MTINVNPPGSRLTYEPPGAIYALAGSRYYVINTTRTLGAANSRHFIVPAGVSGTIVEFTSVLDAAIAADDAVLTLATNFTGSFVAVTNGALTITQSGSAAGDVDTTVPTAANTVVAGNIIRVADAGDSDAGTAGITIVVKLDDIQQGS